MKPVPLVNPFTRAAHGLAMALAAALAAWGLATSARLAGVEPSHSTTKRVATCAALLVVAGAYSFTALRRWSTWRAIPFFLWSYIFVGLTVDYQTLLIVKDFAPDEPTTMDYAAAYGKMVGALAVALLLAFNSLWAARARAIRPTQEPAQGLGGE